MVEHDWTIGHAITAQWATVATAGLVESREVAQVDTGLVGIAVNDCLEFTEDREDPEGRSLRLVGTFSHINFDQSPAAGHYQASVVRAKGESIASLLLLAESGT